MNKSEELIIIYVKDPETDEVKSRLAEVLGKDKAIYLYKKMLEMARLCLSELPFDLAVSYSSEINSNDLWNDLASFKMAQEGNDLGQRMYNDFQIAFEKGYEKVLILGSDIPELTPSIVSDAFDKLDLREAVVGPSFDGGYYLIGFSQTQKNLRPIFENIEWSTSTVLAKTVKNLKREKIRFHKLTKLKDIDVINDLKGYEFLLD